MAQARKKGDSTGPASDSWTTLLCKRKEDVDKLNKVAADAVDWKRVMWGTGSNGPGFDFYIGYEVGHSADKTVWVLETHVYIEPEGEKDEDYEIRAEVDPHVTTAAAVRVPEGTPSGEALERLIELWESCGDSRVPDAVISTDDFSQPAPVWPAPKSKR